MMSSSAAWKSLAKKSLASLTLILFISGIFVITDTTVSDIRLPKPTSPELNLSSSSIDEYGITVLEERLKLVKDTCVRFRQDGKRRKHNWRQKVLDQFLYGPKKMLAYCHVPKAASTWWLSVFARSFGRSQNEVDAMEKNSVSFFYSHALDGNANRTYFMQVAFASGRFASLHLPFLVLFQFDDSFKDSLTFSLKRKCDVKYEIKLSRPVGLFPPLRTFFILRPSQFRLSREQVTAGK